jgi:hypothetical protein
MQDNEGVLFGGPQARFFKAGAQGHRSAGMEQQKAHHHHSKRKSDKPLLLLMKNTIVGHNLYGLYECFFVSADFECFVCVKLYKCDGHVLGTKRGSCTLIQAFAVVYMYSYVVLIHEQNLRLSFCMY